MSSHIESNELAASDCSMSAGSTWESNTVCTPRHYGVSIARGVKSVAGAAMMDAVLLLISGASGSGKTSVREAIAAHLEPAVTAVELRHLGAVPDPPTLEWRQRMAEEAVLRAVRLDRDRRHLLLAGDPVAPGEVLGRRGDPAELFARHAAFADWMRGHARNPRHMPHVLSTDGWPQMRWSRLSSMPADRWRINVIDVSKMSRADTNQAALQWVTDAIEGRAAVFRRSATSRR